MEPNEIQTADQTAAVMEETVQLDNLPRAETVDKSCCINHVSKYDIQPGQYYYMEKNEMPSSVPVNFTVTDWDTSYHLIRVDDVYEDYTWFFELWSTRRAHITYCNTNETATINCDDCWFFTVDRLETEIQ